MKGIIKRWERTWGIIYCPGGVRYFLHAANVKSGTPALDYFVQFEVGPPRREGELPMALQAVIGESVLSSAMGMRRPGARP